MEQPVSTPDPRGRGSRIRRFWASVMVLIVIALLVYAAARVLTAMGDQVPPAREPLPSSFPTLGPTPAP